MFKLSAAQACVFVCERLFMKLYNVNDGKMIY